MKKNILLLLSVLLFIACNKDDDGPAFQSLLSNASVEDGVGNMPEGWWSNAASNIIQWTDTDAFSGNRSLVMTANNSNSNFSFWAQTLSENLNHGQKLRLSAYLKLDDVQGAGISLVIRGDESLEPEGPAEFFYSTQDTNPILGTHDWQSYSIATDKVIPSGIQSITVYLILLPNTTGTAYFDAIALGYF